MAERQNIFEVFSCEAVVEDPEGSCPTPVRIDQDSEESTDSDAEGAYCADTDEDISTLPDDVPDFSNFNVLSPIPPVVVAVEESIEPQPVANTQSVTTYTRHDGGSKRGETIVADSDGYSYVFKDNTKQHTIWRCSYSQGVLKKRCPATARENEKGEFTPGAKGHVHPGRPGMSSRIETVKKVMCYGLLFVCG